jgi:hypothetical protein
MSTKRNKKDPVHIHIMDEKNRFIDEGFLDSILLKYTSNLTIAGNPYLGKFKLELKNKKNNFMAIHNINLNVNSFSN